MEPIRTHRNENIMKVEILGVRPSLVSAQDTGTFLYFPPYFSVAFLKLCIVPLVTSTPVFSNQPGKSCYVAFWEQHISLWTLGKEKEKEVYYSHTQPMFVRIHHCYFFPKGDGFFPTVYLPFLLPLLTLALKCYLLILELFTMNSFNWNTYQI